MSANPPGGVNLTVAIFALVGAVISIVGFIAHYSPSHQYGDFCSIVQNINDIFADSDYECQEGNSIRHRLLLLPSDESSSLYRRYCSISANLESLRYLVSIPPYVLVFHVRTAFRLRRLRIIASQLKIELIALSQIERGKKIQKIMEISPSPISIKTPQATTSKVVNDCEYPPV